MAIQTDIEQVATIPIPARIHRKNQNLLITGTMNRSIPGLFDRLESDQWPDDRRWTGRFQADAADPGPVCHGSDTA